MKRRFVHLLGLFAAGLVILEAAWVGTNLWVFRPQTFWTARLKGADADLRGARLGFAPLARADFTGADLRHATLLGADLRHAYLPWVNLEGANLTGADLRGALFDYDCGRGRAPILLRRDPKTRAMTFVPPTRLTGSDLRRARYDKTTRWPLGFDPRKHGAIRCE